MSVRDVEDELVATRGERVVEVTFDRPHRHHAFTRAFAAGNEISDFQENDAVADEDWIHELLVALLALPQVTLATVDGVCVGGGLAVATHCDLRIATQHSRFGYPIDRTLGNARSRPASSTAARASSVIR